MVCSEAAGKVCGACLGNGSVDKSIGGYCCIKYGNWKEDEHYGEMKETGMMCQGVWITSESEV